jgi:RimJ/RimL family protein N-acetyltransferase
VASLNSAGPITLQGNVVRLEPLSIEHVPGLAAVGIDEEIWRNMPYGEMKDQEDIARWVRGVLALAEGGADIPFAVIHLQSGRIAGATRYMDIRPAHRGLEIGGTWYGPDFRRTGVNTECKYLLLQHAFEVMKCIRVQFKTDSRNERSQRAIERLGAVKEGMLRNHMILPDGHQRHSVYYSILESEWPRVKTGLEQRMGQQPQAFSSP